jgi:hypothetical protein
LASLLKRLGENPAILLVASAGLVGKYSGWIEGIEDQYFFEIVNVLAVLYAVLIYHLEDL